MGKEARKPGAILASVGPRLPPRVGLLGGKLGDRLEVTHLSTSGGSRRMSSTQALHLVCVEAVRTGLSALTQAAGELDTVPNIGAILPGSDKAIGPKRGDELSPGARLAAGVWLLRLGP